MIQNIYLKQIIFFLNFSKISLPNVCASVYQVTFLSKGALLIFQIVNYNPFYYPFYFLILRKYTGYGWTFSEYDRIPIGSAMPRIKSQAGFRTLVETVGAWKLIYNCKI